MPIIYCSSYNIGKLLQEINHGLKIRDTIIIKVELERGEKFYCGYFAYHGFELRDLVEESGSITVELTKIRNIKQTKDKKYSWLIKLPRTGKNGARVFVYKFRTMEPYSEYIQDFIIKKNGLNDDGTIKNDFRITKIGKFLRRYWLDELPMLLNLLKGDLKLIGFRPLSDSMLSKYPKEFVAIRNRYKPGLIPPYYIDRPNSFSGLIESEKHYIQEYQKRGVLTDILYFYLFVKAVLFKGVRSS